MMLLLTLLFFPHNCLCFSCTLALQRLPQKVGLGWVGGSSHTFWGSTWRCRGIWSVSFCDGHRCRSAMWTDGAPPGRTWQAVRVDGTILKVWWFTLPGTAPWLRGWHHLFGSWISRSSFWAILHFHVSSRECMCVGIGRPQANLAPGPLAGLDWEPYPDIPNPEKSRGWWPGRPAYFNTHPCGP